MSRSLAPEAQVALDAAKAYNDAYQAVLDGNDAARSVVAGRRAEAVRQAMLLGATQSEVGRVLGMTHQRVSQILSEAS